MEAKGDLHATGDVDRLRAWDQRDRDRLGGLAFIYA